MSILTTGSRWWILLITFTAIAQSLHGQSTSFDLTAQFDDFTTIIVDGDFQSNDIFNLPTGDCHSDLNFSITPTGDIPQGGFISIAATNLTTGAFLQVSSRDAFGDFVFETDDLIPGNYSIQIDFTDNINPIISSTFQITINDISAPIIDIPGGTLSLLSPSVCEADRLQVWSFQAFDDCNQEVEVEVLSVTESDFYNNAEAPYTYNNGLLFLDLTASPFEVTPNLTRLFYTITTQAQDIFGNSSIKQFNVQVDAPSVRGINSLACNDTINVTLDANCYAVLSPDVVLEGLPNACEDRYYVKVAYPYDGSSINAVDRCGIFKYTVHLGDANNSNSENDTFICWGYVQAEDKTPAIGCINKVVGLLKKPGSATPIKQHDEIVDTEIDADYFGAIDNKKEFKKIGDTYYKYEPVTNENPNACLDDGIAIQFESNNPDINLLVLSDIDSIFNITASYLDPEYAYYMGIPKVSDNCSKSDWIKLIKVEDQLIGGQCGFYEIIPGIDNRLVNGKIIRTFTYNDEKGNQSQVQQEICFFKPIIELPECKKYLDVCWYGTENDFPPVEIGSFPTLTNGACITFSFLHHVSDITVTYEDLTLPGPAKCGDKIIRTWTILDWCWTALRYEGIDLTKAPNTCFQPKLSDWSPKKLTWEQHLIIGDEEPPIVTCPEADEEWYNGSDAPVFSTNGFDCTAAFEVPPPLVKKADQKDACNYQWSIEIYTEVDELWHGVPTGNKVTQKLEDAIIEVKNDPETWITENVIVSNIPKGAHYFKYKVEDICGKVAYSGLCPFFVIDEIAPVAICNEDFNISLGENNARIYAKDVDEGSYDNCSEITSNVRRFVPAICLDAFIAATELNYEDLYQATNGDQKNSEPFTLSKPNAMNDGASGYWTPWHDFVEFSCCDAKTDVLIELRVLDNANMSVDGKREAIFGDKVKPFPNINIEQADNYNICWLEAFIEDKIPPICIAPNDREINCAEVPYSLPEVRKHSPEENEGVTWGLNEINDPDNALIIEWLNTFNDNPSGKGGLSTVDNCASTIKMIEVRFFLNCQSGYIEREFQATDDWNLTTNCVQKIWINRLHNYCILFPKDVSVNCKQVPEVPGVLFESISCDLLSYSVYDERFNTDIEKGDDSECYKIFRTYRVLNWCQFDEDLDPSTPLFDVDFDVAPLLVGRDEDCDQIPGNRDVFVRFLGLEDKSGVLQGCAFIGFNCNAPANAVKNVDRCGLEAWDYTAGFYQYTQVIKVHDSIPPFVDPFGETRFPSLATVTKTDDKSEVCTGPVSLSFDVVEECTPDDVLLTATLFPDPLLGLGAIDLWVDGQQTAEGAKFNFDIPTPDFIDFDIREYKALGDFPIGKHRLRLVGVDGCNMDDEANIHFEVYDNKAPAPICTSLISIQLSPVDNDKDGEIDDSEAIVWATDFIASDIWDCSEPIHYTIERAFDINSGEEPDSNRTSLMLNCDDNVIIPVYIYAWDEVGNKDFCEAQLIVTDLTELCDPDESTAGTISGLITTEEDKAVPEVEVQVTGAEEKGLVTQFNGTYQLQFQAGQDYTITPLKNTDHKNGVSTLDLILISKHILGVESLNSPYKMIAADVNNSGSITTLDLINLRKVILSIDKAFANNLSWRFIPTNFNFPEPENPWKFDFPEVLNLNDLQSEQFPDLDFIAIKVGDVNLSAQVGGLIQTRTIAGDFTIEVEDFQLKKDQVYTVPFYVPEISAIQGYQFTLNTNADLQLLEIIEGITKKEHFGFLNTNTLTTSWYSEKAIDKLVKPLFSIRVKAEQDISLHEALSIGSQYTQAEAYTRNNEYLEPILKFHSTSTEITAFKLYQNEPNPFSIRTKINFSLPTAEEISLSIHDINGKVLKQIRRYYQAGEHSIQINKDQLTNGILYYTLTNGEQTSTRKMIVLE